MRMRSGALWLRSAGLCFCLPPEAPPIGQTPQLLRLEVASNIGVNNDGPRSVAMSAALAYAKVACRDCFRSEGLDVAMPDPNGSENEVRPCLRWPEFCISSN